MLRINPTTSIGFMIGIGAWSVSFVTLIWAYLFYRLRTGPWLEGFMSSSVVNISLINTAMLIISSLMFHEFLKSKIWTRFSAGVFFGLLFVLGQLKLWKVLLGEGLSLKSSLAGSFFYLLTGFHGVHILAGLLILLLISLSQIFKGSSHVFDVRFHLGLKFWDLLLIFWFVLLVLIFFLR